MTNPTWVRTKSVYNLKPVHVPVFQRKNSTNRTNNDSNDVNVNLAHILLTECSNSNSVCLKCKKCNQESSDSFSSINIKKTFRGIDHRCRNYGNVFYFTKKTRMRNRIKRLFRRTKKQPKNVY